ncbi:hypothetical protein PV10_08511 [Exophiala mesophila]|uniref:Mediator of RNA polymerase II transcription subunit 16 n=1 Tax=Exophiala mesophila TaxID=212818 RepID=A0A0D1ZQ01_EXOME|nr:uncharacterized protein PV10_08511 [Exophiala mesophila]KIV88878.1 hypothetical protein PV10_08511 [Exophiala mesophila]
MDQLDQMDADGDDFASATFFNQNSLDQIQQIDPTAHLNAVANVAIPTDPIVVDNISRRWYSGCLERIAWSRHGHIATISDDATTVYIEALESHQPSNTWVLIQRHALSTVFENATSLAWSSTGGELVVVDTKAKISIFQTSPTALNRLNLAHQETLDTSTASSPPIGMAWLNQDRQDRPRNVVPTANKTEDRWTHVNARAKPLGPYWHRAVAVAHRSGLLSLCYQRGDGQYVKLNRQLSQSPDSVYSHASFASTLEGKMLVVLHAVDSNISVYMINIDWSEVKANVDGVPVLTIEAVCSHVSSQPTVSAAMGGDIYDPESWQLSHLEVLQTSDVEKAVHIPPTILAVSTGINKSVGVTDPGYLISSLIKRWTVTSVEQSLHPRFDELPAKGSSSAEQATVVTLQRQPDKEEQVITSLRYHDATHSVIITTQENRTDFLGTDDLSSVSFAASPTEVTSMAQAGFTYPFTSTIYASSCSPSACVRADLTPDGKTQLAHMEYHFSQPPPDPSQDSPTDVALASLNLTFARTCWFNTTIDDVLLCAVKNVPPTLVPGLIAGMYRTLFRDKEYINDKAEGSELERVFHKQVISKVMAYHSGLTTFCPGLSSIDPITPGAKPWTLTAQWAWFANNIRQTATILYTSLRDFNNLNVILSPDFTDILCGQIRWGMTVIRLVINTILEVGDRETNPDIFDDQNQNRLGDTVGDGSQGLVALLINCHWSRIFLVAFVRAVRAYAKHPDPKLKHQIQVLQCIQNETTGKGVSFPAIEALLESRWSSPGDVEGDPAATAARQVEMMATGTVHEAYQGTVKTILTKLINPPHGLRSKLLIDRLKLFTEQTDMDFLFLNHQVQGKQLPSTRPTPVYDVLRKKLITKGVLEHSHSGSSGQLVLRKCVRCGSFSEDVNIPPKDWSRPVVALMGRCMCDGAWIMVPWES